MKRERGRADAFLYADGRDLEETVEIALEWSKTAATWTAKGPAEEYRVSQQRAAIIKAVESFMPDGTGPGTVHETLTAEGVKISYDTVRALVVKMARDGQLESPKRGVYVTVHNVHNVHKADTYRTENVNAQETPVHNNNSPSKGNVNANVNAVHNQEPIPMADVNDVNVVNDTRKCKHGTTGGCWLCVRDIEQLMREGNSETWARKEVLEQWRK